MSERFKVGDGGSSRSTEVNVTRRTMLKGAGATGAGAILASTGLLASMNTGVKAQGAKIPIGGMLTLTGPSAADGIEYKRGLELAIEEINSMGGILGRPLELHSVDTKNQSADEVVGAANFLIDRHQVHAIINGYNIGPQNAEYETIADAGIIHIHDNTLIQHHDTVMSDPDRYFGIFQNNPAEYFYGVAYMATLAHLRDTGQWKPHNNKLAIISGSSPYSIVIANAMVKSAPEFGWDVAFGPEIVKTPTTEWGPVLAKVREVNPAAIANTHFYAGDIAQCQIQFMQNPTNSLIYYQYGVLLKAFTDIAEEKSHGVMSAAMIGLLQDKMGKAFKKKYEAKFGKDASASGGAQTYTSMNHYALAAAIAGGSGEPGDVDQNRKVAMRLKNLIYRGVVGAVHYHPEWQSAIPYPGVEKHDPSLGMPTHIMQVQDWQGDRTLIAPPPYDTGKFILPPWFT